jgi:hypothetical protein
VKFEVNKIGNEFELKFEVKENNTYSAANIFLKTFAALILVSAIYGANTGDYTIFDRVMNTVEKGIDTINKFALGAKK